jgi:hypothetical protein
MKSVAACSCIGGLVGFALSVVGIIFGIFACIPAGPFEERHLGMCVSFLVLSGLAVVCVFCMLVGACLGLLIDLILGDM